MESELILTKFPFFWQRGEHPMFLSGAGREENVPSWRNLPPPGSTLGITYVKEIDAVELHTVVSGQFIMDYQGANHRVKLHHFMYPLAKRE
jgi:hypothetical protein